MAKRASIPLPLGATLLTHALALCLKLQLAANHRHGIATVRLHQVRCERAMAAVMRANLILVRPL